MGFEDFVCFLMSEEDKTNMESLLYWFRVVDIDSDGALRPWELRHFYQEQMARMAMYNYEVPGASIVPSVSPAAGTSRVFARAPRWCRSTTFGRR